MAPAKHRAPGLPAFTLLEALVALIILGVLSVALSTALATALRAEEAAGEHADTAAESRAIFGALSRDLEAAYASPFSPASVFIGSGGTGAQSSGLPPGTLLTLTTMDAPITFSPAGQAGSSADWQPQDNVALVSYRLDTGSGRLERVSVNTPSPQSLTTGTAAPQFLIGSGVLSLQLQFWDPTQNDWRATWDYEQANQSSTNGGAGQASGSAASGQSSAATQGDAQLPPAVQVTLVLQVSNGSQDTYSTVLPVCAPFPMDPSAVSGPSAGGGNAAGASAGGAGGAGGAGAAGGAPAGGAARPGGGSGAGAGGARPGGGEAAPPGGGGARPSGGAGAGG